MNNLTTIIDKPLTMSSREIAKLTSKQHGHVKRDIRALASKSSDYKYCIKWLDYVDSQNRNQKMAVISGDLLELMKMKYSYSARMKSDKVRESTALTTIEQLFGVKLHREFLVGMYRIDGYDSINNVAYEIDEEQHFTGNELNDECKYRQEYIENALGCRFVRIKV